MRILLLALTCSLLLGSDVYAWNKPGHMVTGSVAYLRLKELDPDVIDEVIKLLEEHPQFDSRWHDQVHDLKQEWYEQDLFMLAARWPDDVRGDDRYDRPADHFINYPFKPSTASASVQVDNPPTHNIQVAFRTRLAILRGNSSKARKAVALCWLFHLMGDAHQPLHTIKLFDDRFPEGDRGGTWFYIKETNSSDPLSLHTLWDGMILEDESSFRDVSDRSDDLYSLYPPASLTELAATFVETDFDKWLTDESFELGKTQAYQNGTLGGADDKDDAVTLPGNYVSTMQPFAEKRAALAGYRLAALLIKELGH